MDNKEAIQLLYELLLLKSDFTELYGDMGDSSPYEEAVEIAREAIEKQISQKLKNETLQINIEEMDEKTMEEIVKELNKGTLSIDSTMSEWINCSERMPEPFERVLIFWESSKVIDVALYNDKMNWWQSMEAVANKASIKYWMPLPERPE
ncbi:MAG: DUF551 domain-containing protein [Clostridia bacterium]|nr:DUF551 domain-containing protein [Clostridia bacterium]